MYAERPHLKPPLDRRPSLLAAATLGMRSLEDMERAQRITLPAPIHTAAQQLLHLSTAEVREWWFAAQATGSSVTIGPSGKGPELDMKELGLSCSLPVNDQGLVDTQYGLYYHTHPPLSHTYLRARGISENRFQKYVGTTIDQHRTLQNLLLSVFSSQDLSVFEGHKKYLPSWMIGFPSGYRLLIAPQPLARRDTFSSAHALYTTRLANLIQLHRESIHLSGTASPEAFTREADLYLQNYCRDMGYLAYGNADPTSPDLYHI